MEPVRVEFKPKFEDLISRLGGDLLTARRDGMVNLTETVKAHARKIEAPHAKTGNLTGGINAYVNRDGTEGILNATAKNEAGHNYARDVHDGTGIYGPSGKPIVPKNAKALLIPGVGFRKSAKGFKGRRFMDMAVAKINPQKVFDAGVMNYLRAKGWIKT